MCWLEGFVFLIAGALIGWAVTHVYYRRGQRDLKDIVERAVAEGVVTAVRDATGRLKGLAPPSAPTSLKFS
jgi:hypothetical protein